MPKNEIFNFPDDLMKNIGGCCAKGSKIEMSDGLYKKVEDLKKGDKVLTVDTTVEPFKYILSEIECVIITKCNNNKEKMVQLEGLRNNILNITPYHPVMFDNYGLNVWQFPNKLNVPTIVDCEEMYTFVITNRKPVIVEDYFFATYGHNIKYSELEKECFNNVIEHDFFGTDKVITNLKEFPTYKKGYLHLTKNMFKRNEIGEIYRICNYNIDHSSCFNLCANL